MTRQQAIINYIELQTKYFIYIYKIGIKIMSINVYHMAGMKTKGGYLSGLLFVMGSGILSMLMIRVCNCLLLQNCRWLKLSEVFFDKDPRLLKYQYMNVLKR